MEHFQFASHVLAMCKEVNIEKVNIVLPQLEAAITEEDKALNQPRAQEGTTELSAFDKEREKAFRALKLLVELNLQSSDAAILKATTIIKEVMARYPGINKANADKKTGIIKNLVPDLKDTAIMPSINKINAKPYIDRLEKANTSFDNLFRSRLKTTTPKGTFDIKKIKATTEEALISVLRRMDSLDDLEPETTGLQALIKQYNSLVDKKRNLLSQRVAMGKSATAKRMAAYKKLLEPMLPNFIASQGLPENTLTFAGRTKGTNSKRLYLLISADGGKTYWVRIDNDHLVASQVKQKHRFLK